MEMAVSLAQQVVIMFLLMGVGVFVKRRGIISYEAGRMISNIVLLVITPAVLVDAFQRDLQQELLQSLGVSCILVVLFHLMAIALTKWLLPDRGEDRRIVERLLAICSNCGYIGIPLLTAAMGPDAVIYAVVYIAVFNVYLWTHAVMLLRKSKKVVIKEVLTSPGIVGVAIGVVLFLLEIRLPLVLGQTLGYLAVMNTPLPTIITGIFIADISVKETLTAPRTYVVCLMRLMVLPLVFLALIWALRVPHWFEGAYIPAMAAMISCACPGAVATILFPARYGGDTKHAANLIAVSNLLSVVTLPVVAVIAQWVLAL